MNAEIPVKLGDLCLPEEAFMLRPDLPPGTPFNLIRVQLERLDMVLDVVRMEYIRGERTYSDIGVCVLVETAQRLVEGVKELLGHGESSVGKTNENGGSHEN